MSKKLSRGEIIEILYTCEISQIQDKYVHSDKPWLQITCPIHKESNASMGVNVDSLTVHCFSCHFSGSLSWLIYNARKEDFKSVYEVNLWIYKKYGVDLGVINKKVFSKKSINRYDDFEEGFNETLVTRKVLNKSYLAPYKSGKETYNYFFNRGFTKNTLQKFMIGRNLINKSVTIPVFWEDNKLAGVISRYINPNVPKNKRYLVEEVPKSLITYPQNHLEVKDDTIILVEGILDSLWLHQLGFTNAQSILGNELSKTQKEYLVSKASNFIVCMDNDKGGELATNRIFKMLQGYNLYKVHYPEGKKDVQECTYEEIKGMLGNKTGKIIKKLNRY